MSAWTHHTLWYDRDKSIYFENLGCRTFCPKSAVQKTSNLWYGYAMTYNNNTEKAPLVVGAPVANLNTSLSDRLDTSQIAALYTVIKKLIKCIEGPSVVSNIIVVRLMQVIAFTLKNEYTISAFMAPNHIFNLKNASPSTQASLAVASLTVADVFAKIVYTVFVKVTQSQRVKQEFILRNIKQSLINIISNSGYLFPYYFIHRLNEKQNNDEFDYLLFSLIGATFTVVSSRMSVKIPENLMARVSELNHFIKAKKQRFSALDSSKNRKPSNQIKDFFDDDLEHGIRTEQESLTAFVNKSIDDLGYGSIIYTLLLTGVFFYFKYDHALRDDMEKPVNEYLLSFITSLISYTIMLLLY